MLISDSDIYLRYPDSNCFDTASFSFANRVIHRKQVSVDSCGQMLILSGLISISMLIQKQQILHSFTKNFYLAGLEQNMLQSGE